MFVDSPWLDSLNSCLCARSKWWLMPSPKACRTRPSSGTVRSWLVMLLSTLVYYVASGANFEHWLWALRFCIFLRLIIYIFDRLLRCVRGGWAAFDYASPLLCSYFFHSCFHDSLFFWFAQYRLLKIPLLWIGGSDTAPTNKICRHASSEQRPQTRSCHQSELLSGPFYVKRTFWKVLFPIQVAQFCAMSFLSWHRLLLCVFVYRVVPAHKNYCLDAASEFVSTHWWRPQPSLPALFL